MKLRFHVTAAWADDDESDSFGPQQFPGRWNPVRSFPQGLELLPTVAGKALARAGLWRPGSGEICPGGLVVGADGGFFSGSLSFAREIRNPYSPRVSPSDFIRSLPSTPASFLSMLFGLGDYQSTVLQGSDSGVLALGHALDLVALGRVERALVVAVSESAGLAAALTIATSPGGASTEVELEVGRGLPPGGHHALVELARWLERDSGGAPRTFAGESSVFVTSRRL